MNSKSAKVKPIGVIILCFYLFLTALYTLYELSVMGVNKQVFYNAFNLVWYYYFIEVIFIVGVFVLLYLVLRRRKLSVIFTFYFFGLQIMSLVVFLAFVYFSYNYYVSSMFSYILGIGESISMFYFLTNPKIIFVSLLVSIFLYTIPVLYVTLKSKYFIRKNINDAFYKNLLALFTILFLIVFIFGITISINDLKSSNPYFKKFKEPVYELNIDISSSDNSQKNYDYSNIETNESNLDDVYLDRLKNKLINLELDIEDFENRMEYTEDLYLEDLVNVSEIKDDYQVLFIQYEMKYKEYRSFLVSNREILEKENFSVDKEISLRDSYYEYYKNLLLNLKSGELLV